MGHEKISVIGMALGVGLRCLCLSDGPSFEPYSVQNPMPLFSDPKRASLARELYGLYRESGAQRGGVTVLLRRGVWEPWAGRDAKNVVLTRVAVTHNHFMHKRESALTYVIDFAQALLGVVETGTFDKAVAERIQIADAGIQAELGVGLGKPQALGKGASLHEDDLSLQEQWSLLKVYALVFRHFAQTVMDRLSVPEGWGAIEYFETSMVTKYTAMFTSDDEASADLLEDYGGKHLEGVRGNIFFAPRMTPNALFSFKLLLRSMEEFVGTQDNSWLAHDTRNVIMYWHVTLLSLLQAFEALHGLQEALGSEKSKPNKINLRLLPWGRQLLAQPLEDIFKGWLGSAVTETELLMRRNQRLKMIMFFDASLQQKYTVLLLMSSHLLLLAHKMTKALSDVQALDRAAQKCSNAGNC